MIIREGRAEDMNQILTLFERLDNKHKIAKSEFKSEFSELRQELVKKAISKNSNLILLVACKKRKIIGFIISSYYRIREHPYLKEGKYGEFLYIFIHENFRKIGIGRKLIEDTEKILFEEKKVISLEMKVYSFNNEMIPEKYGFKVQCSIYEKSKKTFNFHDKTSLDFKKGF